MALVHNALVMGSSKVAIEIRLSVKIGEEAPMFMSKSYCLPSLDARKDVEKHLLEQRLQLQEKLHRLQQELEMEQLQTVESKGTPSPKPPLAAQRLKGKVLDVDEEYDPQVVRNYDRNNDESMRDVPMRDVEHPLTKLNPQAQEFVPSFLAVTKSNLNAVTAVPSKKKGRNRKSSTARKRQVKDWAERSKDLRERLKDESGRVRQGQWEDGIRRTVYVCHIDERITELQLANFFICCGEIVDCRLCADPRFALQLNFAFVEFTTEEGARRALNLTGTMLGLYSIQVRTSRTAILPVNPDFLPQSETEKEACARTVYCTNVDSQANVKKFFEASCGEVAQFRLLGDVHRPTRMGFVEFVEAHSAMAALKNTGRMLGSHPIRVTPSKSLVKPRPSGHLVPSPAQEGCN